MSSEDHPGDNNDIQNIWKLQIRSYENETIAGKFYRNLFSIVDFPVTWFKENVLDPTRAKNKQYYYHRRYRPVPPIDECNDDDAVCMYEADQQFRREKLVDSQIMKILKQRFAECCIYYGRADMEEKCALNKKLLDEADENFFHRYGDIGYASTVKDAYMRQKHRMVWERRHGKIGSGMRDKSQWGS